MMTENISYFQLPEEKDVAFTAAVEALHAGELVVMPTDTVYGLAADARVESAVTRLLTAKGRGRQKPSPVLIGNIDDLTKLCAHVPSVAYDIIEKFWPGALTLVLPARDGLGWDLGETGGTVAVRMPDHSDARQLLTMSGPLAVSSANLTGEPPALGARQAYEQLREKAKVYLDAGKVRGGIPSTILSLSSSEEFAQRQHGARRQAKILREGAIAVEEFSPFNLEF